MAVAPTNALPPSASGVVSADAFDAGNIVRILSSLVVPTRVGQLPCAPWPDCVTAPTPTFPGSDPRIQPGSMTQPIPFPNVTPGTTVPAAGAGSTRDCIVSKCGWAAYLFPNIGPPGSKECIASCQQTVGSSEAPGGLAGVASLAVVVIGIILVLVALALIIK